MRISWRVRLLGVSARARATKRVRIRKSRSRRSMRLKTMESWAAVRRRRFELVYFAAAASILTWLMEVWVVHRHRGCDGSILMLARGRQLNAAIYAWAEKYEQDGLFPSKPQSS